MSYTLDFCACITSNLYFKIFVVTILGLILTFVDEIDIFKSQYVLYITLTILVLMSFTNIHEFGAILLLVMLAALNYNMILHNTNNDEKTN